MVLAALIGSSAALFAQPHTVRRDLKLEEIPIHDPWLLADPQEHTYYLYATSDLAFGQESPSGVAAYTSKDMLNWSGPFQVFEVSASSWANPRQGVWAPEVHFYKGKYYLFATLHNYDKALPAEGNKKGDPADYGVHIQITYQGEGPHLRGTQVFVSDSPLGPFRTIVDKPVPPSDFMTLDGTFYMEDGVPYMVYAHEWQQIWDGTMEAVRMKQNLSAADGTPFQLFKASDAPWLAGRKEVVHTPQNYVTDGPEMYRTRNGKLLMIWSSYRDGLYVETLAHSDNGKIGGNWKQDDVLVGGDSGHGMIFHTFDGHLMLILHHPFDGRFSRAKLYELEDTGDTIRIKP